MSSRHSLYKSQADRVWPRAADRSPRTYRVRAMRRSLAFEGLGFEVGGARGAALHRIGCRVPDGGATRAVQQLAATSSCHMAREMMPFAGCILVMALSLFDVFLGLRKVQRGWHELPKVTYAPKCSSVFKALSTKRQLTGGVAEAVQLRRRYAFMKEAARARRR